MADEKFQYPICDEIREFALSFPESSEGASCVNRAFKAGSKNFVFLGEKDDLCTVRLKLEDSVPDLKQLSAEDDRYAVGSHGWTTIVFAPDRAPEMQDLKVWITESFMLLAPKKISKQFSQ